MSDEVRVTDPNTGGEKGQKLARFDLLPWDVLWLDAEHYGKGAEKYEDRNWERGYAWSLSYGALGRHFAAWCAGEDIDDETGSNHLVAVRFHAAALLRFTQTHPQGDDRPSTERVRHFWEQVKDGIPLHRQGYSWPLRDEPMGNVT